MDWIKTIYWQDSFKVSKDFTLFGQKLKGTEDDKIRLRKTRHYRIKHRELFMDKTSPTRAQKDYCIICICFINNFNNLVERQQQKHFQGRTCASTALNMIASRYFH